MQKAISGTCHNISNSAGFGITSRNVPKRRETRLFSSLPLRKADRLPRPHRDCRRTRIAQGGPAPTRVAYATRVPAARSPRCGLRPCVMLRAGGALDVRVGAEGWVLSRSNKRMCDWPVCERGHTMEMRLSRLADRASRNILNGNLPSHAGAFRSTDEFARAFTYRCLVN